MTATRPRRRAAERSSRLAALGCLLAVLTAALMACAGPGLSLSPLASGPHWLASAPVAQADDVRPSAAVDVADVPTTARLARDADPGYFPVCSASDATGHGSGCRGPSDGGADATLPGPPPSPGPAAPPRLPTTVAVPAPGPAGPLPTADHTPDLHLLQVMRT